MTTLPTILHLCLFASPSATAPAAEPPAPELAEPNYDAALTRMREADASVLVDPGKDIEELAAALEAMADFAPQLAADEEAGKDRLLALLNLAQAYQLADQPELAAAAMDAAVRSSVDGEFVAEYFGKTLEEFYEERREALTALGEATLEVSCALACKVYVNEAEVQPGPQQLPVGDYRVWVESVRDEREALRQVVELPEAGAEVSLVFELAVEPALPPPPPPPPPPERIMERPPEIAMTVIGAGVTAIGATLAGVGATDNNAGMIGGGVATRVVGAGSLTTGVVLLSIDETRTAKAAGRQAVLSWSMQF